MNEMSVLIHVFLIKIESSWDGIIISLENIQQNKIIPK